MNEYEIYFPVNVSPDRADLYKRLDLLVGFLQSDAGNDALMIEIFYVALRCGEWDQAKTQLEYAKSNSSFGLYWSLREADFWLAQKKFIQARDIYRSLNYCSDKSQILIDVVLHNMAFIDLSEKNFKSCIDRLASRLQPTEYLDARNQFYSDNISIDSFKKNEVALQKLWLRALHFGGELNRAMVWLFWADHQQLLCAQSEGIASLIALDCSELNWAKKWSESALKNQLIYGRSIEALVTQSSLALARQDAKLAMQQIDMALEINPEDGRSLSLRGLVDLLNGKLSEARGLFSKSLKSIPDHIGTWHSLAWTEMLLGNMDEAQLCFERALKINRNFADSHGGIAVILTLQGQQVKARDHIKLAMSLDSHSLSGQYAQALLDGKIKDFGSVRALVNHLLQDRTAPMGGNMSDWLF